VSRSGSLEADPRCLAFRKQEKIMQSTPGRKRQSAFVLASFLLAASLAPAPRALGSEPRPQLQAASAAAQVWGAQRRLGLCVGWMAATSLATALATAGGGALGGTLVFLALLPPLMDACS
jgi:hypothetical protein